MSEMIPSKYWLQQRYAAPEDDRDFIDSHRIGQTLWARKWAIAALVCVVTLLAALALQNITPVYRAVASLVIEPKGAMLISFQPTADASNPTSDYLQTQISLIQSRSVAERAVTQLSLSEHPEFDPRQRKSLAQGGKALMARLMPRWVPASWGAPKVWSPAQVFDASVQALMDRTSVAVAGKSQLVTISVSMADSETAAAAANALAHAYLENQLDVQVNGSQAASRWMNTRLVELRSQLQASEDKLQVYRDAEGLVDVDGVVTITANELAKTSDRMVDARKERADAQSQYLQVQALSAKGALNNLSSVPAVISNPVIQQFQADEAHARAKVDELSRRYGDHHPQMIAARSELAAAQTSLRNQVAQVVSGIEHNYQLAQANENTLRSSFNTSRAQIQDISRKEFKLRELQRDVDSNRSLYDTFATRLRETTATADIASSNARIVDSAIAPSEPTAPRKPLIMLVAALMALALGCVVAVLRDTLHNSFKSSEDVQSKLHLPVLGVVPLLRKKYRAQITYQFERNDDAVFSESIRTLRTSVMLGDMQKSGRLLVVTSSIPGEGKSAIAINLACSLGQLERVLLVEADLRRPTLTQNLGLADAHPGLSSLIAGSATSEACIQRVGQIDILVAGAVPSNPLELLASPRFGRFLEWAKTRYDRVIVDSPASQSVSDAALLCAMADSVIFVVKSGSTPVPLVQRCLDQLLHNGAPLAGVVLNQVDTLKSRAGYDRYHAYLPLNTPR
jgi:capsular exopolysaccharide synthesis family protein